MEGSTDRGFFGLGGHKKEEDKHQQQQQQGTAPYGTRPGAGTYEGQHTQQPGYETGAGMQQQPMRPEHGHGGQQQHTAVGTYSAAPGVPPPGDTECGEGQKKPGLMDKIEGKLGIDKMKKGHKKGEKKEGGDSSSSSSDEDESGEKKKKHGIF